MVCRQISPLSLCLQRVTIMAAEGSHVKSNQKKREKIRPKIFRRKKKKDELSEIRQIQERYEKIDPSTVKTFEDFPLSNNTLKGLKESNYIVPTEIQRESIGYSLRGEDILGAAQTGSGKTLAFLIPVLEILHCKQWTQLDGLGALIITPTRELAYQIFETLKNIGKYHNLSAGLVIGGKDLHFEKKRLARCNIIICTPGRILHHMDINPLMNTTSLQILVLDEADKCLDLGFEETMNNIIENLPQERQTLLYSATQTKSVKDLVRLSLKNPKYVAVHESKQHSTPDSLEQSYVVCELHDKINFLWSFIKNHKRQKILIFLSTCKQVKYIYTVFCRLRPGSPLLALYGSLHQLRRMRIYNDFCSKQNVVMFATDIAARGLDFPNVDWVVQLDCPEDGNTYIHRAGRTARYKQGGECLLLLLPSEQEAMVAELEALKIPINEIKVNPTKLVSPIRKIEALLARDANLKADAQRAFVAYVKWVFLMKNKKVFKVQALDFEKFAASLGLAITPRVRFLKGKTGDSAEPAVKKPRLNNASDKESDESSEGSESESDGELDKSEDIGNFHFENNNDDDDDDDILTVKRRDHELDEEEFESVDETANEVGESKTKNMILTKAAVAKKMLKKKIIANKKVVYDEQGQVLHKQVNDKFSKEAIEYEMEDKGGVDIQKARKMLRAEDKYDKQWFKERVKEKHRKMKRKLKNRDKVEDENQEKDDFGTDSDNGPDGSTIGESEDDKEGDDSEVDDDDNEGGREVDDDDNENDSDL